MLDASSISIVLDTYVPERSALVDLLATLSPDQWSRPTECPAYTVKGVATHVLGDDLSLLSRQRDCAQDGLSLLAVELPNAGFRTLLDTFNDRWVGAATFFSPELLIHLLRLTGEWTAAYYQQVDPEEPGESVGFFGAQRGEASPFWHAIGREYVERWVHHSQIRRALGFSSLAERRFLAPGVEVAAAVARMEAGIPEYDDDPWSLGPVVLGPAQQAADILTRAHSVEEVQQLATGPDDIVSVIAALAGRP
ncbi:MAG: maleylpyruvate isomerase family mycothiol-dependent enzyme [Acidimicrobiaceae bacterium]|nr:maleylpyruvate isomerase family mycothiol-dependent enzyme [Acidimicrobiaceae bacterium]